jgi:uncharacterized protein (TIGR00251 family)
LSWYKTDGAGVTIQIHAQPGAKRTDVAGLHGDCLKLRLASPPVDGKANACLIGFLALRLGVKKAQVTIIRGTNSRRKSVFVAVAGLDPAVLLESGGDKA